MCDGHRGEAEEQPAFLTAIDHRTGKEASVEIRDGAVPATFFHSAFTASASDGGSDGVRLYDPAYQNTAAVKSAVSFIDGERGVLRYRGYAIEELAERASFLEVAYLLIYGELPTKVSSMQLYTIMPSLAGHQAQYADWKEKVMKHTFVHTRLTELMSAFNYDAHPMGMFISSMAAMSTFHPEANPALHGADLFLHDERIRNKQIVRILGKAPTVAAAAYRHRIGRPANLPRNDLDYAENFLYMLDQLHEKDYRPHPRLVKALDVMFTLHAEHEMNCSTAAMRHIASSRADPYSAVSGAAAALYGPLHGGANEAVLRMLEDIGSPARVPAFLSAVKERKRRLMGFGHRVYRNYDPRARIIQRIAYDVFEVCGREPLIDVALALEKAALADAYFVTRKLYPNVDFYSGLIYRAMGFPTDFFPVLFAIPRVAGWLAHWRESFSDPEGGLKIWRPRQIYTGHDLRPFIDISKRIATASTSSSRDGDGDKKDKLGVTEHPLNRRYAISVKSRL